MTEGLVVIDGELAQKRISIQGRCSADDLFARH
jgi:hypothetical protein